MERRWWRELDEKKIVGRAGWREGGRESWMERRWEGELDGEKVRESWME